MCLQFLPPEHDLLLSQKTRLNASMMMATQINNHHQTNAPGQRKNNRRRVRINHLWQIQCHIGLTALRPVRFSNRQVLEVFLLGGGEVPQHLLAMLIQHQSMKLQRRRLSEESECSTFLCCAYKMALSNMNSATWHECCKRACLF